MSVFSAKPDSKKKTTKRPTSGYERRKDNELRRQAKLSAGGRDIGPIEKPANAKRRAACRLDLRKFCETYNPIAFSLGWSSDHLLAIKRIEEAVLHGALYAFAMPRGQGKTTICRMAALWAISYAHRRYVFIIGANAEKAEASIEAIKIWIRFLPTYGEDFPEISQPAVALAGIANRASGQTCEGAPTMIAWGKHKVVLPTVKVPPAGRKKIAATAGIILAGSGLEGDGIRGSVHTLTSGEQVRPDFVLLDDPQTDESAGSPSQNAKRERLIAGAVLGMAGPDKSISAVMPCTVIERGDMADQMLDRKKNPLWRGTRRRLLPDMPEDLSAWDAYFDVYDECALAEPPNFDAANAYYLKHRAALDAGFTASWEHRYLETEVSAIQHAMHLYHRDRASFFAEYQNDPEESSETRAALTPAEIYAKVIKLKRGTAPLASEHISLFIDVQKACLWYIVVAWSDRFGGHILDYGAWPDQKRKYYTLAQVRRTLQRKYPRISLEGQIYAGLKDLADHLLGQTYKREDRESLQAGIVLIDANWGTSTSVVKKLCREYGDRRLIPTHGQALGPEKRPMNQYKPKTGERLGWNWLLTSSRAEGRHARYDGNQYKTLVADRIRAGVGDAESLTLYHGDEQDHRMIAEQLGAEYPIEMSAFGRTVEVWKAKPNRDNHLFDCLVGSAVGASLLGVRAIGHEIGPARKKPAHKTQITF